MVKPRARHHKAPTRPANQRPRSQRKGKKPAKIFSNALIAEKWDRKQTLSQNYARLGLTARLERARGGVDHNARKRERDSAEESEEENTGVGEVEVVRDEKGRIVRVLSSGQGGQSVDDGMVEEAGIRRPRTTAELRFRPLNSSDQNKEMDDFGSEMVVSLPNPHAPSGHLGTVALDSAAIQQTGEEDGVIGQLARRALYAQKQHSSRSRRKQSHAERRWCADLIARHGQDYRAMSRDVELNIMQQSEGDVQRRVETYLKEVAK
ncbi:MAG: Nucleolar protein 16 [Chrysothrix sp. TS-e1954]|nr:MAG: Nucleolar protein 16 [Chrysothrix sp. TS-e1954]